MHKPERERKGGLSCAECRRSKLRCDRNIPCSACVRRNCAGICPDGTLAATKGNKVLQNQNQSLHEQVKELTARVRELEAALAAAQAQVSSQAHPLLQCTDIPESRSDDCDSARDFEDDGEREDVGDAADGLGSLSIGDHGAAKFHGRTAGSEFLQGLLPSERAQSYRLLENVHDLGLPWNIVELVNAFPFGEATQVEIVKPLILQFLPGETEALRLSLLYFENIAWMYDPIPHEDYTHNIMVNVYDNGKQGTVWDRLHSHQLAVFFLVLAVGALVGDLDESEERNIDSERYYALACASFALQPMTSQITCSTIQALFVKNFYLSMSERTTTERRWLVTGLTARVSQAIGLQRDSAAWNLDPAEVQRRRVLFWELYTYDAWTSVIYGRPPALNIRYTDCRFPEDKEPNVGLNGETELGFHAWKFRLSATLLSQAVQHVFSTKIPDYSALLDLDHRLRRFPVPSSLMSPTSGNGEPVGGKAWANSPSRAMMQHCVLCTRESVLLYIHRSYLARAIRVDPANPINSNLHGRHPKLSSHVWFFWSAVFSSCIVLGALVIESPSCSLSGDALQQLDQGVGMFVLHCSRRCRPAGTVETLLKLQKRAHRVYADHHAGQLHSRFEQSAARDEDRTQDDDLHVLGGGSAVISVQRATHIPPCSDSSKPVTTTGVGAAGPQPVASGSGPAVLVGADADIGTGSMPAAGAYWDGAAARGVPTYQQSEAIQAFDFSAYDFASYAQQGIDPTGAPAAPAASTSTGAYMQQDYGSFTAPMYTPMANLVGVEMHPTAADTDVAMDNVKPNEQAIWQNFLSDLGIPI